MGTIHQKNSTFSHKEFFLYIFIGYIIGVIIGILLGLPLGILLDPRRETNGFIMIIAWPMSINLSTIVTMTFAIKFLFSKKKISYSWMQLKFSLLMIITGHLLGFLTFLLLSLISAILQPFMFNVIGVLSFVLPICVSIFYVTHFRNQLLLNGSNN